MDVTAGINCLTKCSQGLQVKYLSKNGCVARRGGKRSTLRVFMCSVKETENLESLDVNEMTLNWTLKKEDNRACFGFIWPRMEKSGVFLFYGNFPCGFTQCGGNLKWLKAFQILKNDCALWSALGLSFVK